MSAAHPCAGRVWSGYGHHPCRNNGKVEEDKKWWCRRHAPSIVQKQREARNAQWEEEWAAKRKNQAEAKAKQAEIQRRAECYPALLAALKKIEHISHLEGYTSSTVARRDIQRTANAAIEAAS